MISKCALTLAVVCTPFAFWGMATTNYAMMQFGWGGVAIGLTTAFVAVLWDN